MPSSSTSLPDPAGRRSGARHPLSVSYLVIGLVFLGIAALWALHAGGLVDGRELGLLLPLTFVVAGGVGLVAFTAKGVGRARRTPVAEPGSWDADDEHPHPTP